VTFEEFAVARMPALLRYALMLTGDEHLAQDLVQETLIRVQLHWRRVARADRPELYVKRMAVNLYLGWRRGSWSRRNVLVEAPAAGREGSPDPAEQAADRDEMWLLLGRLPRRQRAVLVLRYYEELTDHEIAGVLGCRVGTVRGHASRALATLRTELVEPAVEGELR
jgi:RNA polymerase sigma-70 factor (sigma-E family)